MLALAAFVLGLFVISQLVALTDAGHRLIESAGLTPAEYARSGFFQLCWAAGLVLAFLWLVRSLATPAALASPLVRGLGTSVPSLALGLVVVSLRRMALYDQAFGLTMLRLWVVGAALWMGSVFVMTAVRNAGVPGGRNWLVAGAGASAVALVLAADVGNPEAFVARHNLARADQGAELDVGYLVGLSDDAVPVLADALDGRGGALRCSPPERGAAVLNLAVARADDIRDELCGA
jgi:two-component system sensor histidine kinase BaeS